MGSKRAIIEPVVEAIARVTPPGAVVHDAFAGTHSVGYALRNRFRVVASDIQQYSAPIGRTLLSSWDLPPADSMWGLLSPYYEQNMQPLTTLYSKVLAEEQSILAEELPPSKELVERFAAFQHQLPNPVQWFTGEQPEPGLDSELEQMVRHRREVDGQAFPYVQMVAYFGNTYLGIMHAIQADSVRYAIDRCYPEGHPHRAACLAALMFAVSYTNASPGHFAMWRDANTAKNTADILLYRRREFLDYFHKKLSQISSILTKPAHLDNRVFTSDYVEALALAEEAHTVYADPPYSFVHYSRFYHALESLIRYDYPNVAHRGRFRDDRHQSPFCISTKVTQAFRDLATPLAHRGSNLVISYSNTGMISLDDMLELLEEIYHPVGFVVWAEDIDHQHSTMGRAGDKLREVKEAFVFCAPAYVAPTSEGH